MQAGWASGEFETIDLGDVRLNRGLAGIRDFFAKI
jgi:hypothetical protein